MKKFLLVFTVLVTSIMASHGQPGCQSHEYLQQSLQRDPALAGRMAQIEAFSSNPLLHEVLSTTGSGAGSGIQVIRIPVVVHVLYNSAAQNISDEQIVSQIEALNRDFRRQNADTVNTPEAFRHIAADCEIEFVLANVDPRGFATSGIVRRQTSIQLFNLDDRIKSTDAGGDDPWDPDQYLNIWVGDLPGALLGYASPVGGPKDKDGVVVSYRTFGATANVAAPFNKGRIGVHEVGHWLGLRHIWGDRYCGDDYVNDTPPQQTSSYGCPSGTRVSCNNAPTGNMYMNYMDLTHDACTNLFTIGQKEKMRSLFLPGGYRHALLSSGGAAGNGLPAPVELPVELPSVSVVHLFPNPVQSVMTVDISGNSRLMGQMLTVYGHLGQPAMQVRIVKEKMQIAMQGLKAGMYYVRIGEEKEVYKVVKAE